MTFFDRSSKSKLAGDFGKTDMDRAIASGDIAAMARILNEAKPAAPKRQPGRPAFLG